MSYVRHEDLILEIFKRLPTKSLLRFRSVSKSVCSCIGSPSFIRLHSLYSPKRVIIMHQRRDYDIEFYTIHSEGQLSCYPNDDITDIEYPFLHFRIIGSCNGVICFLKNGNDVSLWNPSTRRILEVKGCPYWSHRKGQRVVVGFGFDPIIDDYKILKIIEYRVTEQEVLRNSFVYTLKTGTWCEIASPTMQFRQVNLYQCLFNGALHWVVFEYGSENICPYYIMTFNLSTHVFSSIALPEQIREVKQVTLINGSLAVISTQNDNVWIWVMTEYNNASSWSVAFEYNISKPSKVNKVLELSANGDLLTKVLFEEIIHVYNPETEVYSCLKDISRFSRIIDIEMYVETLELLDMGTSCQ